MKSIGGDGVVVVVVSGGRSAQSISFSGAVKTICSRLAKKYF